MANLLIKDRWPFLCIIPHPIFLFDLEIPGRFPHVFVNQMPPGSRAPDLDVYIGHERELLGFPLDDFHNVIARFRWGFSEVGLDPIHDLASENLHDEMCGFLNLSASIVTAIL